MRSRGWHAGAGTYFGAAAAWAAAAALSWITAAPAGDGGAEVCAACRAVASVVAGFHADPAPYYLERTVEEGGLSVPYTTSRQYTLDVLGATCSHPLTLAQRPVRHWWGKTSFREDIVPWYAGTEPPPEQAVLRACHGALPVDEHAAIADALLAGGSGVRVALASEKVLCQVACARHKQEASGPEWWRSAAASREGGLVLLPAFMLAALCPLLVWRAFCAASLQSKLEQLQEEASSDDGNDNDAANDDGGDGDGDGDS